MEEQEGGVDVLVLRPHRNAGVDTNEVTLPDYEVQRHGKRREAVALNQPTRLRWFQQSPRFLSLSLLLFTLIPDICSNKQIAVFGLFVSFFLDRSDERCVDQLFFLLLFLLVLC